MHSQRDWRFLSVQVWTYCNKRNQHFRSSQNTIVITLFGLNIFQLFFYHFYHAQPCVITNYKRSFMKLLHAVLCFVLYVTQGVYLQKVKSIKICDGWRIIRPSHTANYSALKMLGLIFKVKWHVVEFFFFFLSQNPRKWIVKNLTVVLITFT